MSVSERPSPGVPLDTLFKKQVDTVRDALQNFNTVVPLNSVSLWKSAMGELVSQTVRFSLFALEFLY